MSGSRVRAGGGREREGWMEGGMEREREREGGDREEERGGEREERMPSDACL